MNLIRGAWVLLALLASATSTTAHASTQPRLTWSITPTNTIRQFRGLAPVSDKVVWVSGTAGTVLRTTNGGSTWANVSPSLLPDNATTFEFRDIQAYSAETAVIMSIGEGNASRIYRTTNGGKSWKPAFINQEPTAFYDCMAFENEKHGLAMSDPVNGKFRLIETWDGGASWKIVDPSGMPAALTGEAGFAASGTCLEAAAGRWYLASGGVNPGRIYRSNNGHDWKVTNSSITGGAAAGVFSVRFRDAKHGLAVGGDYQNPTGNTGISSWSDDGGATWQASERFPAGYRSGASWIPGRGFTAIAVGTSGSDITFDGGKNWRNFDNGTFDAVECIGMNVCWASGLQGRVARLSSS
ncbi:hypothetical protein HBH56_190070 [Parastagonospora nodorum]|uniref:Photosynthesis system II assembly factor Ycf48/Hcf136-like domain-containing protein n=1 Tax=Phaeosphaeria nodorum (strain SN15 / ATCC MYA-4574 / FGSC 10173) TaxID=321614 RepID=A0A7U2ESS8_PHANO|nr:hypothetical protein HBH56_190070 [Parastagonospora nodorum]QRC92378.1 hypothetical protein JI435_024950 [Parastagonospora nodorum SN15]KAH3925192.1 hypothetical protein HBH54_185880 [Parastagonospora nodorum]KAH3953978.1 hypothetical protein HBH53_025230 [Parastagonospora nodorum]KAH3963670.1 hypothetical protein HBH51_165060 [Parastagonospora nodorum]